MESQEDLIYCPKCGKKLGRHALVCEFCGYNLRKKKVKQLFLLVPKKEKPTSMISIKKPCIIIGLIITFIDLTYIITIQFLVFNPYIIVPQYTYDLILYACFTNPIGMGLIFFSVIPKFKGLFLIIIGYISFYFSFLAPISIDYYQVVDIQRYLGMYDIPTIGIICFGILTMYYNKEIICLSIMVFIVLVVTTSSMFQYLFVI
ncbi:MAG: hypothetical protein ACFFCL_14275 [Promethearchaeota archaeon]